MNVAVKIFELVFVVIASEEIFLFFGKLPTVELKLYGIQVELTSTVAGCIAGVALVLVFFLILFLVRHILRLSITATGTTTGFSLLS